MELSPVMTPGHSSCVRLSASGGSWSCDPGVSVPITVTATKQDPSLPACRPFTWSFGDGSPDVVTTEPRLERVFPAGLHFISVSTTTPQNSFAGSSSLALYSRWGSFSSRLVSGSTPWQTQVSENAGTVPITVGRNDARFRATIDYAIDEFGPHRLQLPPGTLVFEAGEFTKTVNVIVLNDSVHVSARTTATFTTSNPTTGYGHDGGNLRIEVTEDDPLTTGYECESTRSSAREADGVANIGVVRTGSLDLESIVRVQVEVRPWGVKREAYAVFGPGESRKTVAVDIQDSSYTGNFAAPVQCTGQARLSPEIPPAQWTGTGTTATLDITDDESVPVLTIPNFEVRESDAYQMVLLPIIATPAYGTSLPSVHVTSIDGTARHGDYSVDISARLLADQATGTIEITIYGDDDIEGDETFQVIAESATSRAVGTVTIRDDDGAPTNYAFAAPAFTAREADGWAYIGLRRSGDTASASQVTLYVDPLKQGDIKRAHEVHFAAGATTAQAEVHVNDQWYTGDRNVKLELYFAAGTAPLTASMLLIDDEPRPTLSIQDFSVAEGDREAYAQFPLSLSGPVGRDLPITITLEDGTTTRGSDYTRDGALPTYQYTIRAGDQYASIELLILGDEQTEPDETFTARITDCCGELATLGKSNATFTIRNDDPKTTPTTYAFQTPGSTTQYEPAPEMTLKVLRSGNVSAASTAVVRQKDSVTGGRTMPELGPFTVSFAANETEKEIRIPVDDNLYSGTRNYPLELFADGRVQSTIELYFFDNETLSIVIGEATVMESPDGAQAVFTMTVNPACVYPLNVSPFAFSKSAVAGSDFDDVFTPFTLPAQSRSTLLSARILDDGEHESDEEFGFGAVITVPAQGLRWERVTTAKILDDDAQPQVLALKAAPASLQIPAGTRAFVTITLDPLPAEAVRVTVANTSPAIATAPQGIMVTGTAQLQVDALTPGRTSLQLTLPPEFGGASITIPVDVLAPPSRRRSARH